MEIREEIKIVWREPLRANEKEEPLIPERLLNIINTSVPVIYTAPSGIGKTSSLINYGFEKNHSIFIQECSNDMLASDLTGKWGIKNNETIFLASEIASALFLSKKYEEEYNSLIEEEKKQGKKMVMLIIDEINLLAPAVMKGIGSVFDSRKYLNTDIGRIYGASEHLLIVGTMNSESDSAGYSLDPAVRSRFIIAAVDTKDVIDKIANTYSLQPEVIKLIKDSNSLFSIREIEQLIILNVIKKFTMKEAFDIILSKYEEEQKKFMMDLVISLKVY